MILTPMATISSSLKNIRISNPAPKKYTAERMTEMTPPIILQVLPYSLAISGCFAPRL